MFKQAHSSLARISTLCLAALFASTLAFSAFAADDDTPTHKLGGGIRYWRTLKELKDDPSLDRDGISYIASYQFVYGWLKIEGDIEVFPKHFRASDEVSVQPMVYAMLGGIIYGGVGIGTVYTDDDDLDNKWSDPVMALRAGLDLPLLPDLLHLDINANYQFTKWADWNEFDTDTIFLGAQARLVF